MLILANPWQRFGDKKPKANKEIWLKTKRAKKVRRAYRYLHWRANKDRWHLYYYEDDISPRDDDLWCYIIPPNPPKQEQH